MDKYLLQILHEVNTIIIPGLGALTVTNKSTGEIMFMSYLKHNDGTLAKHISEKEGISENDAKNLIAKYVRDIQAKLGTGDTYDMYQFGRFVKNSDGEIDFEQWNTYQHAENETFAPEKVIEVEEIKIEEQKIIEESDEKKVESKIEKAPVIEQATDVISELLEVTQPIEEKSSLDDILNAKEENKEEVLEVKPVPEENIPEEKKQEEALEIDTSIIEPSENIYIPKEEIAEIAASQKAEKPLVAKKVAKEIKPTIKKEKVVKEKVVKEKTEKKRRSAGFWFLICLGALLLIGGIVTVVFYDKIQHKFFAKTEELKEIDSTKIENDIEAIEKQVALEQEEENSTETNSESEITETPEREVVKADKPVVKNTNGDLSYHIIAGSFGVEGNANRLAKKYTDAGKNSSVLGKFDDMFLVSYESFASKEEAMSALKSSEVKGWVFKYPK